MNMFLRPDALGFVDLLSDSMPSRRVCTTSRRELFVFSAKHTHTHITFCLFYHVVLCVFSLGLIPRFWHSLHIFSHSQVFPLTFLILLSFGSFLNIGIFNWLWFERLCMNIFFCLYAGWILLICVFWIAISTLYFFMHPIDSHHNTTFFLKLTRSNRSLWCYFWIDFCLNIFRNMLSGGFQHSVKQRALWKTD